MSEMPTCTKCGRPHWRFATCADADRLAAVERTRRSEQERLKVHAQYTAPPGYVRVGPNKFAHAPAAEAKKPSYVQIAPGKYRKA